MPSAISPRYWFVVPAAGVGARMNANKPKQYLQLNDKTILEHTLQRILMVPHLAGVVVVIDKDDCYWNTLPISKHLLIHAIEGGVLRANSVLNGLHYLADKVDAQDWILVHDAARPCITLDSISLLCSTLETSEVGGILALPVSDTLKQVAEKNIIQTTVDRHSLWHAQTPQMFRYKLLRDCLMQAMARHETITDESSAVEICGFMSHVVEGRSDNIKITRPDDLLLAEFILQQQNVLNQ